MPRPPEMTVSASVSSGRPVETSSRRSTSFMRGVGIFTLGFSTCALLATEASAGLKTFGRIVAIHGVFAHVIFASTLPAYTGRVATSASPSIANPTESADRPAPRRAARQAAGPAEHLGHDLLGRALPIVLDDAPVCVCHVRSPSRLRAARARALSPRP